jgi:predicted transcriptional regulator
LPKGRVKWTKEQIAAKARYAKTKYKVLAWLAKQKNPVTAKDLTVAMNWMNEYYAPRLLLSLYRQGLVKREAMIVLPTEIRPKAKLPYLYTITKKGLSKVKYWGLA